MGAIGSAAFFKQASNPSFETYLYFSYVTLVTVGYGDFTPASSPARALAITEGVFGPLYLVTVVAVLVSNIGRPGLLGGGARPAMRTRLPTHLVRVGERTAMRRGECPAPVNGL